MFITELMKLNNLAISASENLKIIKNESQYQISSGPYNYDINNQVAEMLIFIQNNQPISLVKVRAKIPNRQDSANTITMINNLIYWNHLIISVVDDKGNNLMRVQNSTYGAESLNVNKDIDIEKDAFTISRFAFLTREESQIILIKAMQDKRFIIDSIKLKDLIFMLFYGASMAEICAKYNNTKNAITLIIQILVAEKILTPIKSKKLPTKLEEGSEVDVQWNNIDLLFHSNSRIGNNFGDFGGGFPFINKIDPRPAIKTPPQGEKIDLYKPDINKLMQEDVSLTMLQMTRMSVRKYNEKKPITIKQIAEFLYRTSRIMFTSEIEVKNVDDNTQKTNMELAWRPYPTGGASYELEIYLTVDRADGLGAGMYYYSPKTHQLIKISEKSQHTEALIDSAYISCAKIVKPQILLHIAARFQRVSWKYNAISYATNLRNTGVLYQTFYLNAVAMNLAPCGLGSGNLKAFANASGNDPLIEGNIGEFMLGSLPEGFSFANIDIDSLAKQHGAINAGKNK